MEGKLGAGFDLVGNRKGFKRCVCGLTNANTHMAVCMAGKLGAGFDLVGNRKGFKRCVCGLTC